MRVYQLGSPGFDPMLRVPINVPDVGLSSLISILPAVFPYLIFAENVVLPFESLVKTKYLNPMTELYLLFITGRVSLSISVL